MATAEHPLTEADARLLASTFRQEFRNAEAFEHAWNALFELRSAITLNLARRFLREELVKFRAHSAGLDVPDFSPAQPVVEVRPDPPFVCPACERRMDPWDRTSHAADCPHAGCYALEVRFRVGIARRNERPDES